MRPDPTRCLLLIDDEPAQRRLVTAIGARAGWWVRGAPDVEAAAKILADVDGPPVDAILLDHWLPGPDGTGVIEQIRTLCPHLPLLVMTAQTSVAVAVEAMRAGAHDFLVKPIAPDSLLAALNAATDRRQRGGGELRPLSEKISNKPLAFGRHVDPRACNAATSYQRGGGVGSGTSPTAPGRPVARASVLVVPF